MTVRSDANWFEPLRPGFQGHPLARRLSALFILGAAVAATVCYASYRDDCARLRRVAETVVVGKTAPSDQAIALLHWVYGNQPTAENRRYFLFQRLRATPWQVLETGGDCADKSRLLSTLLREVRIPASMAMCFDPQAGKPTHTVVVATLPGGATMVVDPVYDLYFPKAEMGQYYTLLEMREDATILTHRLDRLCAELPRSHPVHYYKRGTAGYSSASCINWQRNSLTRGLRDLLFREYGNAVYALRRPVVWEEPKLFVCAVFLSAGAVASAASCGLIWVNRRTRARHVHAWVSVGFESDALHGSPAGALGGE